LYISFYLRFNTLPPSSAGIALIANSGTMVGNIHITSARKLCVRNNLTQSEVDSSPLTAVTIYCAGYASSVTQARTTSCRTLWWSAMRPSARRSPLARSSDIRYRLLPSFTRISADPPWYFGRRFEHFLGEGSNVLVKVRNEAKINEQNPIVMP